MLSDSHAFHGGAFFDAIGADFRTLERSRNVISADVLDAWFDPSPLVIDTLREYLPFLLRTSPPTLAEGLTEAVAAARGIPVECVLPGSGSSSLIFSCLPQLIARGSKVLLPDPTYGEYEHVIGTVLGAGLHTLALAEDADFAVDRGRLAKRVRELNPAAVILVNPNSPTGVHWPRKEVIAWLDTVPLSTLVWIDETYIEYAGRGESLESEAAQRPNVIVVKSMSKVYALSGMRVAYLVAMPETVACLSTFVPPWPVGLAAQVAAVMALRDPAYYDARYRETHQQRELATTALREMGIPVLPSGANFYLARFDSPARVAARLRERNIFVREFPSGPLADRYLRIAVKSAGENARILDALRTHEGDTNLTL